MSLWFQRKSRSGQTGYYTIPFAPFAVLMFVGVLMTLLLPTLQAFKAWLGM